MQKYHTVLSMEIVSLAFLYDVPRHTVKYTHASSNISHLRFRNKSFLSHCQKQLGVGCPPETLIAHLLVQQPRLFQAAACYAGARL